MLALSHKKLVAWQKSILLVSLLYKECAKLPREETFNLSSQIKRAGLSISNNIAEGSSRISKPEKNRFFEIARSSAVEIDNSLIVCVELGFFQQEELQVINELLLEIFKLITGLIEFNKK